MTDPMPAGLALRAASGVGWDCAASAPPSSASCLHAAPIAPAAAAAPVVIRAQVVAAAGTPIVNTAEVSGGGSGRSTDEDRGLARDQPQGAPAMTWSGIALAVLVLVALAARGWRAPGTRW